ncbi:MAG: RbsD/FucU domain-containing protein [Eubacteriales bacterium]|nr:RbsD/FucU domain-containing protein [Eubacteriales bacterium]
MKKDRILNPQLLTAVATTGHTDYLVIADCGLPIPRGVEVIDVSVRAGLPRFIGSSFPIDTIATETIVTIL